MYTASLSGTQKLGPPFSRTRCGLGHRRRSLASLMTVGRVDDADVHTDRESMSSAFSYKEM